VPIGDTATFAISGKGLAYSDPSPSDHTPRRDWNETSPPKFSPSVSGRCRATGSFAHRTGADLSDPASAFAGRFCTGGPNDIVARLMGERLSAVWGKPVVIDNLTGAGGNLAADRVVSSFFLLDNANLNI
jgi:hypothetical protein